MRAFYKKTPYRVCPHCGAHLDAGEVCDCRQEPRAEIAEDETDRGRGLVAIRRDTDPETGKVTLYPVRDKIGEKELIAMQMWARCRPQTEYFITTAERYEGLKDTITSALKHRSLTEIRRVGGLVKL